MNAYESDSSDLALTVLRQFAGGPGPPENNLVRFGLPIIMWTILLVIAWSRQRSQALPRERWLVWAFGLGLAREIFMFGRTIQRMVDAATVESALFHPVEHALSMAAIVVVAGAFLRYVLDAPLLARRFLQAGAIVTVVSLLIVYQAWPRQLATNPQIHFHQTWEAWIFHVPTSVLIIIAIYFLIRRPGWLPKVVSTALFCFFMGEFLFLFNFATEAAHNVFFCPIANTFHILAIPILGYIYLREQAVEKRQAENKLAVYRNHLEDLVEERTIELQLVNDQLTTLHLASSKLANTLDLAAINKAIARQSCVLLRAEKAIVLHWEKQRHPLTLAAAWGLDETEERAVDQLAASSRCPPAPVTITRSVVNPGIRNDEQILNEWKSALNGESLLYLPVWVGKTRSTLLIVTDSTKREWRPDELSIIESFADRAAAALENAHLHQQLEWAAALEERQRIAANIHDGLAQTLSLLGLKVDQISESYGAQINGGWSNEMGNIRQTVEQASLEARRSIASLHEAPPPRQSLQELLSEMIVRVVGRSTITARTFFAEEEPVRLTAEQTNRLLPIVQEMLVNAVHHSGAEQVVLSLQCDDLRGVITVQDDGCGFDPKQPRMDNSGHFGLTIMRARAAQLNGKLEIDSEPGQGTAIRLIWPTQYGSRPL